MKQEEDNEPKHWFKPNGHWNFIKPHVYEYLQKFFGEDLLRESVKQPPHDDGR